MQLNYFQNRPAGGDSSTLDNSAAEWNLCTVGELITHGSEMQSFRFHNDDAAN